MKKTIQFLVIIAAMFIGVKLNAQTCTANAGPDQVICCPGGGVTIGGGTVGVNSCPVGAGVMQYNWLPVTGLSNPNAANPVASPATTTTYTVCVVSYNSVSTTCTITCCVACDVVVVTVNNSCCRLRSQTIEKTTGQPLDVLLYPNPAASNVLIEVKNLGETLDLEFFDSNGKVVSKSKVYPGTNQTSTVDTSGLPRGLYFVKATTLAGSEVYSGKVVLE
jgi:hypothetical protein